MVLYGQTVNEDQPYHKSDKYPCLVDGTVVSVQRIDIHTHYLVAFHEKLVEQDVCLVLSCEATFTQFTNTAVIICLS